MERQLDQQLSGIRQDLLRMGALVEQMIDHSTQGLLQRDDALCKSIRDQDLEVDRLEMGIDRHVNTVLVRNQPAAVDLRFLVAVLKINTDLERMGDTAVNIARSALELNQEPPLALQGDLPRMSKSVQQMVHRCLDAFVARDVELARQVIRSDDEVDAMNRRLFHELVRTMADDPRTVNRALRLLLVARNLERIADHATNVAEDVIYYVEGRDVRHAVAKAQAPG